MADDPENPKLSLEASPAWAAVIREFFIDFLGSLVPGLLFSITAALPVWWSAALVWRALQSITYTAAGTAIEPLRVVGQFRIESLCLLFVLSYVLGGVFYRGDPKFPDQKSAAYVLWREVRNRDGNERREAIQRCVIQPVAENPPSDGEKKDVPLGSEKEVRALVEGEGGQFPYSHLYEYLHTRGLGHLAEIVPWRGNDYGSHGRRTKMFINLLKVRLHYTVPQKCGDIVRNEAHIRMMSSVWYAASALQQLCYVATVPAILSVIPGVVAHGWKRPEALGVLTFLLFLGILFFGAETLRLTIRKFFHYQRVREIVYVLKTAYFATKEGHTNILEDLS